MIDPVVDETLHRILDEEQARLLEAILSLAEAALPDGSRRKKLKGVRPPTYRLRQGNWRVMYEIERETVRVLDLIRRRDLDTWIRRRR